MQVSCSGKKLDGREASTSATRMKPIAAALTDEDWDSVVLTHEPVWAIGIGKVTMPEQVEEVYEYLRKWLGDNVSQEVADEVRILYERLREAFDLA